MDVVLSYNEKNKLETLFVGSLVGVPQSSIRVHFI